MIKQRRLLAFVMSVVLMCSMLPISALAADPPLGMISIPSGSDWKGSVFGDISGAPTAANFGITENADKTVKLSAAKVENSNKGKISKDSEGMAYYFQQVDANDNFELSATAKVDTFTFAADKSKGQSSFGIMLRKNILMNENQGAISGVQSAFTGEYIAVGALDLNMKGFYKSGNPLAQVKTGYEFNTASPPSAGVSYALSLKKSGNVYILKVGNQTQVIDKITGSFAYAGLYVARNTAVTFSDVTFKKDTRAPSQLKLNTTSMKTDYFVSDSLDLTGLKVTAVYPDNHEEDLSTSDYAVSGFDNTKAGTNTIIIHFNGQTASIPLNFKPLVITAMDIKYKPAKTDYYPDEYFDAQGLTVLGQYNGGSNWAELASSQYAFSIPVADATVTNATYKFTTAGIKTVTVRSTVTSATYMTFDITVKAAQMTGLEIRQKPQKTVYYIGDKFVQDGIAVYAKYSDNTEVKLLRSEYSLTAPDMTSAGTKTLTVTTYKGTPTGSFNITVKQQAIIGSQVTKYPKTTYAIGETLDMTGLEVSTVYDSTYKELLPAAQYAVDASAIDNAKAGVYNVSIIPVNTAIPPTVLKVTVAENKTYEWKSIRFGQSTSDINNKVTVNPDGTVQLVALEGGGKVTGDHDGITFYYTELDASKDNFELSANIKVVAYAKDPHDGQESFGIMARDAIGTPGDSSVFASNIAAIGGYSGSTTKQNGTQLFVRTGITAPNGAGSQGVQSSTLNAVKPSLSNTYPAADYKLTLIKTNSGFTGRLNNGTETSFYVPDIMTVQDGDKMYVGFYTARLATIEVSDMNLKVTAAETDAPKVEPAKQPVAADINFAGLTRTSKTAYSLGLKSNVNGTVTIKQGPDIIAQAATMQAGKSFTLNTTVTANTYTNFSAVFVPDDTQYLTSYDKIVKNFTVDMKTFVDNGDIYVSPTASAASGGDGTINNPLDLDTAVDYVKAGQKIILLDGRYVRNAKIDIKKGNDGTADAKKYLVAGPGAKPIIDFDKRSEGVVLSGNYWHVKGIDFTRTAGNTKGFTVGGNHNIVESSRFYDNGDTGLQISRTDDSEDKALWPSYNLILNCESFDNIDPSNNNADGFAAKLTSGIGNVFRGDIAHNNIDDGWDLYTKSGTGAIGAVTIEDSIAYHNGTLTNGTVGAGDKNGFKLGGEGIHVPHVIRNSIAFGNGAYGFASNSNPGVRAEATNIAFNNARGNLNFTSYTGIVTDFRIDGFISYQKDYSAKDNYPAQLSSNTNYLFDGSKSVNKSGSQLTDGNFASLVPVVPYQRDADGNIIWGNFLKLIASSDSPSDTGNGSGPAAVSSETVEVVPGGVEITSVPITEIVDGKSIATVTIGVDTWTKALDMIKNKEPKDQTIVIQVISTEAVAKVEFPASAIQAGAAAAALSIRSNGVTYNLPLHVLDVDGISKTLGTDAANVTFSITIEKGSAAASEQLTAKMKELGITLLSSPVEFNIVAEGNGKKLTVKDFGSTYVARILTLDQSFDPNQATAVMVDPVTGELTFVPAIFNKMNGQTEVTIKRTGNSWYTVVQSSQTFDDVKGHWAKADMELLASKLVIKGVADRSFAPNSPITRAEFAALLVRALGLNEETSTKFSDVPTNSWYAGAVSASVKANLIEGYDDASFKPNERITREQMAVMITRAMKFAGKTTATDLKQLDKFKDNTGLSVWSKEAVAAAVSAGIVNGATETSFAPQAQATRAEAAVMLKRLLQFVQFMN